MAHAAISRPAPRSALCLANPQELSRNLLLGPPDCRSATAFESRRIPPVDSALLVRKNSNRRNLGGGIRFGADGCRLGRKIARTAELNSHRGVVCLGSASGREGEFGGYFVNELPLPGAYEGLIRRRALKMATMAVPRALMEDTTGDDHGAGDLERAQQSEYGTFGPSGDEKAFGDSQKDLTVEPSSGSSAFVKWDSTTARLADSATAAFLLLQLPQILLNTQNLVAGNYAALFAVPWMGQLTGLLGNLSLLSYFASKRERGAMVVQAVGVVSTLIVLLQLAIAGAMPAVAFAVTGTAVVVGLILNFLNYVNKLSPSVWRLWGEVVSIGGVTVLPQVMWSTFEPYLPHSVLPGTMFGILAVTMIALDRLDKLPAKIRNVLGAVAAWTATLLFMWAPVAQWWTNYINPANIRGLSVFTVLLAMVGNSLLLPRALFTRDLMWFTGSSWGTMLQGWGILLSMYMCQVINDVTFYGVSAILALWLSSMLWNDSKAYNLGSPFKPLVELISGSRR
ncbi:hypothetical protein MPTK1_7g16760 [Marchantia polymorpha subsp. ruderalis]|uniref:Maltose excess protein 1-like, chloroplastic n=2 Tax=Marchantia polymorpha TaxID=3197 RepID=A0A176W0U9_MARPO|nr:hypothetical protein AXG93_2145s1150 [Marchantia polymorpha subsp. ruderalis]PTQ38378.1 hypothetical protein MARPO_0051s0014 [Marchantia polymorpha]BBN17752.1 hypothetical protein Mp_7g16760 [Marchantia polymorpha subsp. ruderalis]|eukprot:PTQ38378.1 hypothetical protein MARPO_0051s0014 [Marchantia polymorpha]